MTVGNNQRSTTTKVWEILVASKEGDLQKVKSLVNECPDLIYAQYNYTPPIHLAVREGHLDLVKYFLDHGAHDPGYKIYPFQESLQTIALDRDYHDIADMLDKYGLHPSNQKHKGDNGEIHYDRTVDQQNFEKAVYKEKLKETANILSSHPEFALNQTYFWSEGILTFAAKENNHVMIDLLMSHGATVPHVLKWTQFYYFERYDAAVYMMEKGMNPNTMSWHHVSILHDLAQKGDIQKASLLVKHGAALDAIDEEYQSTPLGMAARWGHLKMVEFLLEHGADPSASGAAWSTPLTWAKKKGHDKIQKLLQDRL